MGAGKLWGDEIDVVFHRSNHRVHHCLTGMTALAGIAYQLLHPLEVDDGYHAYQQIDVTGDIVLGRHHAAVQPFIKQHICWLRQGLPGGERTGNLVPGNGFIVGVQIFSCLACAGLSVLNKRLFQQAEVIRFRAKIADMST